MARGCVQVCVRVMRGEKSATGLWKPAGIAAMSIRAFIVFIFGSSLNVSDLMVGEVPSTGSLGWRFPITA